MSNSSPKIFKRIALTCLAVCVAIPVLLILLLWGASVFRDLTNPYRYDYPEHLKTDDLRVTYEQFDPNLIYLTACDTVKSHEGYSGSRYYYAALPNTDTAEYLAVYEANSFIWANFTPQILRPAGSDAHPILNGTVTAELYLRKPYARDSWSWNSKQDERHLYGQLVYDRRVAELTDAALLEEFTAIAATRAHMEEATYDRICGEMLGLPPEEVPGYTETIHPDGHYIISDFTWGYRPVTNRNSQALYLRLSVAEHPNIVWDAAVYINDEGEYALRRRVYVRPSYAIEEPYAFKTDSYALYYPLSVSLDAFLPEGWDAPAETESETAP